MRASNQGQSAIEYVLLLGVTSIVLYSVFQSAAFKNFIGQDSQVFSRFKTYMEKSYRFTHLQDEIDPLTTYGNYSGNHDSYSIPQNSDTRFFIVIRPYGGGN